MYPLSFALTALLAPAAVRAVSTGKPSKPTCVFSCPPRDNSGFALADHSDNGVTLFCSYPAVQNEEPSEFFCDYSSANGRLTQAHDGDLCFDTAVSSCTPSRRPRAIPQVPVPQNAAHVARASTPNKASIMAKLKKRQPIQVEV